jgi:transposase
VAALVFMARTSTPWSLLPAKELGCGSATTCWRRLDEWARAGVFDQLQAVLLDELGEAGRIDLERVSVDSFSLRAVKGGPDRRRRPGKVHADKAYDHRRCRAYLRRRGIRPRIARRMIESSARLGRHRWRIERTGAWLGGFRRLRIRYERSSERFYALAMLACSVICFNTLQQPPW